jgi:GH25 family lysozyme M1 (1,4-beta-N-acetylmuramidase)
MAIGVLYALAMLSACSAPSIVHPEPYFDVEGFTLGDDGRWEYHANGADATKTGVDVSENQDWIDWYAVADDGIEFAMIRIGYRGSDEGVVVGDPYFEYNLASAQEAGIECGVYFFSQAVTLEEAREEAQFVLTMLDGAHLEYPVAFDFEPNPEGVSSRAAEVSGEDLTAFADEFCTIIENAGYDAMIYGNASDLRGYDLDKLGHHKFWLARYDDPPTSANRFNLWQYSNNGTVNGIDAAVDMNLDMNAAISE